MNQKTLEIQREISKLENIWPNDKLIVTYKDFIKHRNFLHYYQFNPTVFCSIIGITYELWNSNKRINRQSLIQVAKRYFKKSKNRSDIPPKTTTQIFELFKEIVIYENIKLSRLTVEELKKMINSIMIGVRPTETQLGYLCEHVVDSPLILNRVLRYNYKSKVITNWAIKNYEKDISRERRSEITSWIIDEDHNFSIDKETLEFDFEYQIAADKKTFNEYINDHSAYLAVEKELSSIFTTESNNIYDETGDIVGTRLLDEPEFNPKRRVYSIRTKKRDSNGVYPPDFEKTSEDFYAEFNEFYKRTMAWSIGYSRIDIEDKIRALSKFYDNSVYSTLFNIGLRLESVQYFNWLELISNE